MKEEASRYPYNLVQIVKPCQADVKLHFKSLYLLPIITPKSQYVLYDINDAKMANKMATFEIQSISQRDNIAIVNVIGEYDKTLLNESSAELFRAVEIKHVQGEAKHYTKVYVQTCDSDNGCNKKNLDLLTSTLTDLKKDMYDHRTSYPVMKLPPTAFVTLVQNEEDCDIKVKLDGEHIAVVDKNDNLVLPKVELKNADMDVRLVASYIASYAHWNMLRNLKSSHPDKVSITLDEGLSMNSSNVAIEIYGQDDFDEYKNKIEPTRVSNEGYEYHLNWDDSEDGTQPFRVCINANVMKKCHVMLAFLDLDNDISYDDTNHLLLEAGGHKDLVLIDDAVLKIDQDIVKKNTAEADGRWCKTYFEFQIFVSVSDTIRKADPSLDECPNVWDGLYGITSEGIKEPNHSNVDYVDIFQSEKGGGGVLPRDDGSECPWACIPIKIYVDELSKKYARVKNAKSLYDAAYDEDWDECKRIVRSNPNVNLRYRDGDDWTVLHLVCRFGGDVQLLKLMLESNKLDINATNNSGWTALDYAICCSHNALIDVLIQHGAIANDHTKDETGKWKQII